jgi:DNA-binding phage protein
MTGKKTKPFDASQHLENDEDIAAYIDEAIATNDIDTLVRANWRSRQGTRHESDCKGHGAVARELV